jgi:carbamoyltransferase
MSCIIGINEFLHDVSAAIVVDGRLKGAIEEERLSRQKHHLGSGFAGDHPVRSIQWCLDAFDVKESDVDELVFSFSLNGWRSFRILLDTFYGSFTRMRVLDTLRQRFVAKDPAMNMIYGLTVGYNLNRRRFVNECKSRFRKVSFMKHHEAHAASTYLVSGFDHANILVVDGMGDETATSLWVGEGNKIRKIEQYHPLDSLGIIYRTVSLLCGFVYMDAGKTMGLSAYGTHRPELRKFIDVRDDGFKIVPSHLKTLSRHARYNSELQDIHKDMAASVQKGLEDAGLALVKKLYKTTGYKNLCLAGGVALNCVMNSILLNSPYVDDVYIQPAAMDQGAAIGSALKTAIEYGHDGRMEMDHAYWGPEYSDGEIEQVLQSQNLKYHKCDGVEQETAELLNQNNIVGWFQGKMEFGPRALGNRSVLAAPVSEEIRDRVNKLKGRELWRPLAPSVLYEKMGDWFRNPYPSRFMTLNFDFLPEQTKKVPAVVHVDGSARVQTVHKNTNPEYYKLIQEYEKLSGIPILLNTSFNYRGEPIVCTPENAVNSFLKMNLDYLVIGSFVVKNS